MNIFFIHLSFLIFSSAFGEVKETTTVNYYEVIYQGSEPSYSNIISFAPQCVDGKKYLGCTKWNYSYTYTIDASKNNYCTLSNPQIIFKGEIYLPAIKIGDPDKHNLYLIFAASLEQHEFKHINLGKKLSNQIDSFLSNMNSGVPCEQIRSYIKHGVDKLHDKVISEEKEFDIQTNHGTKEGATYPF